MRRSQERFVVCTIAVTVHEASDYNRALGHARPRSFRRCLDVPWGAARVRRRRMGRRRPTPATSPGVDVVLRPSRRRAAAARGAAE